MKISDGELLERFDADPQKGMLLLIEQYTGLVWHIVSGYLSNPEDVKECVNDTFAEFFIHRKRFREEKGTLANFLGTIARNHAVSRYRKELLRKTESIFGGYKDSKINFSEMEERIDLERALKELREDEFEIIRMKYYEGMSVGQIAEQMHLPYETVKKRHQRSISKLRRFMLFVLAVLLGALLTACALNILRHFGIIPQYGINKNTNINVYELKETVSAENDELKIEITEGVLLNGDLLLKGTMTAKNSVLAELLDPERDYMKSISPEMIPPKLHYSNESVSISISGRQLDEHTKRFEAFREDIKFSETDTVIYAGYSSYGLQVDLELVMIESEMLNAYPMSILEQGGLLVIPAVKNEELILAIYPLNTGKYEIVPALIRDAFGQNQAGDVTITSEEGKVLTGNCINYSPISYNTFYEWNFGQAESGTYTLKIPYLFLKGKSEAPFEVMLDLNSLEFDSKSYQIPEGTMKILSLKQAEVENTETKKDMESPDSNAYLQWDMEIQVQMNAEEFELTQLPLRISLPPTGPVGTGQPYGLSYVASLENGILQYRIMVPATGYDLSQCKITVGAEPVCLRWNQEYQIDVIISE